MLEPNSIRVLHDALRPPEGYELEHLLVTTFTLDLVSLLSVPLAFARFGAYGDADALERDPLELLAAVERQAGRITVFHQAAAIAVPDRHRRLLTLVEDALVAVPAPRQGAVFHPKLWVAKYVNQEGKRAYRLLCLSRNLTADRCWDTVLVLDGAPVRSIRAESKPLADFVGWLGRARRLQTAHATLVGQLAHDLSRVRFEPPQPFEQLRFRPLGIRGYRDDPISAARRDRILIVSPFLGADQLATLCSDAREAILVTRPEEHGRLHGDLPPGVTRVLSLDDALEAEPDEEGTGSVWLAGLHAKTYVADQGWNASVWTGSANATAAAFRRNVEFLVELTGKKSTCGIDKILGDGSRGTFASMLVASDGTAELPEDDPLDATLDAVAREIAELAVDVRVTQDESGWTLELVHQPQESSGWADVTVDGAPLASTHSPHRLEFASPVIARFDRLKAQEVSGLFVIDLRVHDRAEVARSFVVSWPLLGAVPDRVHALLRELASDPNRMLAFIRMFLGDGDGDGVGSLPVPTTAAGEGSGADGWGANEGEPPLLELLVRALAREPERLDDLARWLPALIAEAGDGPGKDLLRIWEPIWQARQEMST
jgi:hypothetical protein